MHFAPLLLAVLCVVLPSAADHDKAAQLGFELESPSVILTNFDCNEEDTFPLKGHAIKDHAKDGWQLGVDTTPAQAGMLQLEYDLRVLLANSKLGDTLEQVLNDMSDIQDNKIFKVSESKCNPWTKAFGSDDSGRWSFDVQATGPMMLEGIQDVFASTVGSKGGEPLHPLVIKDPEWRGEFRSVTKDWFQAQYFQQLPNGVQWVTQDVLGFLSAVVSNAKAAQKLEGPAENQGPKVLVGIMPRTYWTTIYEQVKDKFPAKLWDIVNHLACYKLNDGGNQVELDHNYCDGTIKKPQIKGTLAKQGWVDSLAVENKQLLVKDWIESMEAGTKPDALTKFDEENFGGQIGGFKNRMEYVLDTAREVPIWEFRALGWYKQADLRKKLDSIEESFITLHRKYPEKP
ncbi:Uu.00g123400.m01.CDS01 [Anthostomella pinea]|uniref:Uu.00g123400.m01.CDS01 n=1 Tax=Anthostomella pinea TaxID=933095 RepID=A0AAI8VI22_9PEZI|nr:Uu.00g123400.m01.CDS01 [Anthostomella pinea]